MNDSLEKNNLNHTSNIEEEDNLEDEDEEDEPQDYLLKSNKSANFSQEFKVIKI